MSSSKLQEIEQREGKPIGEVLKVSFAQHGSQRKVAKALGVAQGTISLWLMRSRLKQQTILVPADEPTTSAGAKAQGPCLPGFDI